MLASGEMKRCLLCCERKERKRKKFDIISEQLFDKIKYKANVCELSGLVCRNYHTLMTQRDFRLNRPDPPAKYDSMTCNFFIGETEIRRVSLRNIEK